MKQGPFAPGGLCCPAHRHYYDPSDSLSAAGHFPGSPVLGRHASRRPQRRGRGGPPQFPGQPSDRSTPPTPEGPSTPAPETQVSSMAFAVAESARLPLNHPKVVAFDDACAGLRTCCGPASRSTLLRTRHLGHARGHHYRGLGRLPGPDLHRQAPLSLSLGYITTITSVMTPTRLGALREKCLRARDDDGSHANIAPKPGGTSGEISIALDRPRRGDLRRSGFGGRRGADRAGDVDPAAWSREADRRHGSTCRPRGRRPAGPQDPHAGRVDPRGRLAHRSR